ncbi:MAG: gamma-glutamyltransferase, partial [Pseudomonadota bacterium]|nr:gamma-glutamyltransferase [Pseudomonadota bacterium]
MKINYFFLVMTLGIHSAWGQVSTPEDRFSPVQADKGMVVTSEPLATQAGVTVLKQGGNAIDAAVTIGLVMAVTYPGAGNLGGGGFMLIHQGKTGKTVAVDYREQAPGQARRDMFIGSNGKVDPKLSRFSHLAAGVPGTVAGLALALEHYGTLSLAQALAPAIQLAENGFEVTPALSAAFKRRAKTLKRWPASRAIFFKNQDQFYEPGDLWRQPDLAKTLKLLAQQGPKAFYQGKIAQLIVDTMQHHQGLITKTDLAAYQAVLRTPVWGRYREYEICSMPPPSSGGIHIIQILNMLEHYDLGFLGHNRSTTIHLMAEAMKR